jgi:Rad3-related DNA helicase
LKRNPADADALRSLKQTRALAQKVATLAESTGAWVVDVLRGDNGGKQGYQFDPVWPAQDAADLLFCGVPRVLLTSATLNRKTCRLLGIADADLAFFEYPSVFDPRRSPITWIRSGARVGEHMSEWEIRSWISRLDQILRAFPRAKGIIHCTSYTRQKDIYRLTTERARLIWHNAWNTQAKIEEFKQAADDSGRVLISPAVTRGYDFPDAQCRFQIIAKLPLLYRGSKLMKARQKEDPDYCDYLEAQTFKQEIGRPVRSAQDYCQHFVIDDHWAWWYPKMLNKRLLSGWFAKQVTQPSDGIPEALYA